MFQPNEIFDNTYQILQEIGHGGTSVVYLAWHLRLHKYVVIKRICQNFSGQIAVRREADILKNLHHPYLPQVYDFLQFGGEVYTVMDYIEGQGLDALAGPGVRFDERTLTRWLRQMLEVLIYLHGQRPPIIHSDIKPGNIILTTKGELCLIDFNISLDGPEAGKITGYSQYYAAPEQMHLAQSRQQGQHSTIRLDARTDLYSLAATFYTLITGLMPRADGPNTPLSTLAAGRYSPQLLAILDKAMAWQPTARYSSAKKMLAAVERLHRQDGWYRTYVALQSVSWLLSAALMAGGIYCAVRGVQASGLERYHAAYSSLSQAVQQGDDAQILQRGIELLQDTTYQKILNKTPRDRSAILHALGDCYYNDENYALAADYYQQALQAAPEDDPALALYYEDAAIALALAGREDEAAGLLEQADEAGLSEGRRALVESAIALRGQNVQDCLTAVDQVLAQGDAELSARACLLAAQLYEPGTQEAIRWLEQADGYHRSRDTLRQLAAAYMERGAAERTNRQALAWYQKARDSYQALCAMPYASVEDQINLGIAQLSAQDADGCIQTLNRLRRQYPEDYRIELNLAFAYDAKGDAASAAACASRALRLWNETEPADRDQNGSEAIENLKELQKRLSN